MQLSLGSVNQIPLVMPGLLLATIALPLALRWAGYSDQYMAWALLALMPFWVLCAPAMIPAGRLGLSIAGFVLIWLGYQALSAGIWARLPDLAEGRLAQETFAATVFLSVAAVRGDPRRLWLGLVAVSLATLVIILIGTWIGTWQKTVVFGNKNFVLATLIPAVASWWMWLIARTVDPAAERVTQTTWLQAGASAVVVLGGWIIGDPDGIRRGGALGLVCGLGAGGWIFLHARWPKMAWTMIRVATALLVLAVVVGLTTPEASSRADRISIYKASLSTAVDGLPWGWGAYGNLAQQFATGEWARERTAGGFWAFHAHNEWIEAVVNHGIIGGIVSLAMLGALGMAVLRIQDVSLRAAMAAALAAFALLASTDNGFGQLLPQVWIATLLGVLVRFGCGPGAMPTRRTAWTTRGVLAIPALGCLMVAWDELPMITKPPDVPPTERADIVARSRNPFAIDYELRRGIAMARAEDAFDPVLERLVDLHRSKLGGAGPLTTELRRTYHVQREALRSEQQPGPTAERLADIVRAHAILDERELAVAIEEMRQYGFRPTGYLTASEILTRRADLAARLPEPFVREVVVRAAWFRGDPAAPIPKPTTWVRPFDRGTEAIAQATWLIIQGADPQAMEPMLEALAQDYGNIPDVSLCLLRAVIVYQGQSGSWWKRRFNRLRLGVQWIPHPEVAKGLFAFVQQPTQAVPAWDIIQGVYPDLARRIVAGELRALRPESQSLMDQAIRIRALLPASHCSTVR